MFEVPNTPESLLVGCFINKNNMKFPSVVDFLGIHIQGLMVIYKSPAKQYRSDKRAYIVIFFYMTVLPRRFLYNIILWELLYHVLSDVQQKTSVL